MLFIGIYLYENSFRFKLVNKYQTRFIKFGKNLRLVYDILHYTEQNDIPGLNIQINVFLILSYGNFFPSTDLFFNFELD